METCALCSKTGSAGSLKVCSRCKTARYCSAACQKDAWQGHKKECKQLSKRAAITLESSPGMDAFDLEEDDESGMPLKHIDAQNRNEHVTFVVQSWCDSFQGGYSVENFHRA
jgi:hypothetical protein